MKSKYIVWMISVVLILGLSGWASAGTKMTVVNDTPNDQIVPACDILSAGVMAYPESSIVPGVKAADYIKISLHMNPASTPASKMPGIVVMEFDVDNNPATGGTSGMPCIFKACETGTKIKANVPGFDIALTMILREQTSQTSTAWCYQCFGAGKQCFKKDVPCDPSCGGSNCYDNEINCDPVNGPFPCVKQGSKCQPTLPLCDHCYDLVDTCVYDVGCGISRILGEWYATASSAGTGFGAPAQRGRLMTPYPVATGVAADDCYTLPWAEIVQGAIDAGANFNVANATDPANIRWQISVWKDVDFATTGNDFINAGLTSSCNEIGDVLPDAGNLTAQAGNNPCISDLNNSGSVDGVDTNIYKSGYGRSDFKTPCPLCK